MTFYLINKRYYTKSDGNEAHEYYVMPYCLKGSIKAMGFWTLLMHFFGGRAYFSEGMAKYNAKYSNF